MSDNDPLRDLGQRIQSAKQSYEVEPKVEDHHSGLQHAWRMVIELVSGMAIGFGLGVWVRCFIWDVAHINDCFYAAWLCGGC